MNRSHLIAALGKPFFPNKERGAMIYVIVFVGALATILMLFNMHIGEEYQAMAGKYNTPLPELTFQLRQIFDCTNTVKNTKICPAQRMVEVYDMNGVKRWNAMPMVFVDRKGRGTAYRLICDRSPKKYVLQTAKVGTTNWAKAEEFPCP